MSKKRFLSLILIVILVLSNIATIFASSPPQYNGNDNDNTVDNPPKESEPTYDQEPYTPPSHKESKPDTPKPLPKEETKKGNKVDSKNPNPPQKFEDVIKGLIQVKENEYKRELINPIKVSDKNRRRKFEDPNELMSRSEFLMSMIQTKKIIEGRKLLNYVNYMRFNGPMNTYQVILHQPVEDSGFLDYMGNLNIDAGQTDVALNHSVFGSNKIISNPNVIELYLVEAYQKGLFNIDELDISDSGDSKSLKTFLENTYEKISENFSTTSDKIAERWDAVHGPVVFGLPAYQIGQVGKLFEHDNASMGQYPQAYQSVNEKESGDSKYKSKWDKIISATEFQIKDKTNWDPSSAFWGSSYTYIHNDKKLTNKDYEDLSKFDVYPTSIIRISDGSTVRDTTRKSDEKLYIIRRKPRILSKDGFSFFLNENITLLDAYVYAAKYLKGLDNETDISKDTIQVINSAYGVNTSSMTAEEAEAVNFLIAIGVVDGEDTSLYNSFLLPLTNKRAVDLLYKIKFPDARKKTLPTLTELDKAMLEKGYGKVNINLNTDVKEFSNNYIGEPEDVNEFKTAEDIIKNSMSKPGSKGEYELLAIKYPKIGRWKSVKSFKLMMNDAYRTEIPYQPISSNEYNGLEDGSENYWRIYTVHKETISDLKLLVEVDNDGKIETYNFNGISGPGLYWIDEDNKTFNIRKWKFEDIYQGEKEDEKDKDSPIATYLKEKDRKKGFEFIKKLKDIKTRLSMYQESNKNFKISLRDSLKVVQAGSPKKIEDNEPLYRYMVQSGLYEPSEVAKLARIHAGYNTKVDIWNRIHYAEGEPAKKRSIIKGPNTIEQLKTTLFGGDPLIVMNGDKPEINWNNPAIKTMGIKQSDLSLQETEVKSKDDKKITAYNIKYIPKTDDLTTESAKFNSMLHQSTGNTDTKKFGGYAKLETENGENLTLISKETLPEYGIKALSDKVLFNEETGQRAFINTDDNITMIGNNITQYKEGTIMVNAFGAIDKDDNGKATGARDESKIFYNLDIILELINDSDLVAQRAGKDIYVGIDGESFEKVKIRNTEDGTQGNHPVIDITYKYKNKVSNNTFINMSALTGMTSNFIFYKNRANGSNGVEALIVYKPMEDYVAYSGITDNTLKREMIEGSPSENEMYDILSSSYNASLTNETVKRCLAAGNYDDKDKCMGSGNALRMIEATENDGNFQSQYKLFTDNMEKRNSLVKHLFVGSSDSGDIFPRNYLFKLYVLNRTPDSESRKASFTNFYTSMALNLSDNEFNNFFNDLSKKINYDEGYIQQDKVQDILNDDDKYYKDVTDKSVGGLMVSILDIATSPSQGASDRFGNNVNQFDFMLHEPTGNLYMTLGEQGSNTRTQQLKRYQYLFENNIYLQEGSNKETEILFKPRHIYENAPRNMIPLEVYANNDGYFGGMFLNGGKKMNNFETNVKDDAKPERKFKLINSYSSNTAINNYDDSGEPSTNPGMFTRLSANPIVLNFDWIKNNEGKTTVTLPAENRSNDATVPMKVEETDAGFNVNKDGEDANIGPTMAKYLLSESLKEFDKLLKENNYGNYMNLNIYNAIYNAQVHPDNKDMKFLTRFMTHSWYYNAVPNRNYDTFDMSSGYSDRINYNLSEAGLKDGDEVIFLTVGMPKEFIQEANKLKDSKVKELATEDKYQVYMVKDEVKKQNSGELTLSHNALKFFSGIKKCTDKGDKDCKEVDNYIKPLTNMKDLKEFSEDYKLKVMFLPSICVPYGTTLVNRKGYLSFYPSEYYREEVQYATDTINSLIFRIKMHDNDTEGIQYLYQLPKGTVIKFGDNKFVIKASPMQSENNRLKWVEILTSPKNDALYRTWAEMSDYANLDYFLRSFSNKVMIPYNTSNSKVSLKSIIGKGMFNIPTADLVTETINMKDKGNKDLDLSTAGKHINKPIWVNTLKKGNSQKFIIDPVIGRKENSNTFSQGEIIENKEATKNGTSAASILLIYLPPTIEVMPMKEGIEEAHYEALMYHDIRGFVVDPDDSYVQYLRDRDTPATELLKDFEQIQAEELDGRKYLASTKNKLNSRSVNKVIAGIEKFVPIILYILVFFIWVIYLGLYIPLSRKTFVRLGALIGMKLGEEDPYGNVDISTLPSFVTVFWVTTAITSVALLLDTGAIMNLILKIFDFFNHISKTWFK